MSDVPPNIQEFNTITGLIFTQLHKAFPVVADIDKAGIAKAMGVAGDDWGARISCPLATLSPTCWRVLSDG